MSSKRPLQEEGGLSDVKFYFTPAGWADRASAKRYWTSFAALMSCFEKDDEMVSSKRDEVNDSG